MSRPESPAAADRLQEWQRLDPRMLLVHPVRELIRFLPALIALAVAGTASGGRGWQLLGVVVPIVLGVLRYLTTRFRIAEGRIELRRGLVSRRTTSTPLDRVRTVDLTSSLIQRALGLTTLRIGTGVAQSDEGEQLDLDGLPSARARALRGDLLRVGAAASPDDTAHEAVAPLVVFDPAWLRFAPFTGTGLIVVAAVVGGLAQLLDAFDVWGDLDSGDLPVPSVLGLVLLAVGLVLGVVVLSVLGYLVTNGGFRLTRGAGSWHVRRGLLTTRETSIDEERLAGVSLGEPLALRLAGGRHLQAIVTGVNRSETGSSTLVPPSDAEVAPRVAGVLLRTAWPVEVALVAHGPAAARRRWTRALLGAAVLAAGVAAIVAVGGPWWVLVSVPVVLAGGAALAADRVRGLGHALGEGYVVARSGSLTRRREILGVDHVIGWNLRATWFQRRVGLTTLVATTAGGGGSVTMPDVPVADAVRLADAAVPGLVAQFVARHDAPR